MPTGTLHNLGQSGFVRTPPIWAERIARNLLSFGCRAAVLDPTAGEGDLLAPLASFPGVELYGVEISRARADVARQRLPQATVVVSAIEAVRITPASMDLLLCNPPYFFEDGRRAEYRIIADAGAALRPGGILVAILPARSAWDATMINHWCKHYEQVRCWKFPDGDPDADEGAFQKYTQIVVVGVRRATPLNAPETLEQQRLAGWRWRQPKKAESPWAQGTPPPDLPEQPIADPYLVPEDGTVLPELIPLNADEATLLSALAQSGIQRSADWVSATTWQPEQQAEQPIMPPTGEAHLAAEILTGLLDGDALTGPDGDPYAFVTCISQESHQVQLDPEDLEREHQKGVVSISVQQLDDHPVLGALNLRTGEAAYHQGEDVFTFLTPWLSILATRVLAKRQPLYRLNPAQWELEVAARIGLDKRLPGASHPGLVAPQVHRVCAMGTALDARGRVAIQGEPGTGKTRQSTAVMARQAAVWQRARRREQSDDPTPAWARKLRLAWQTSPRARALLGPTRQLPAALPVLVATPKRVTTTWREEITASWPEAEVRTIESYCDIDAWMRRCAESRAPAVIALVPHSQSRAFGCEWQPAVTERRIPHRVPDLNPAEEVKADLEPVTLQGRLAGYRVRATGEVLTKQVYISSFHCPDCGALIQARPWGKREDAKAAAEEPPADAEEDTRPSEAEDEALEPVTERVWFAQKPRWCRACHGALWTETRTRAATSRAHPVPFATWAAGAVARAHRPAPTPAISSASLPLTRRPDGRLSKAHRQPIPAIQAATSRVLDAAGTRGPAAPESFSPYEYAHQFYRGCIGLSIIDESHNARGRATDVAHAIHQAQLAAQTCVYASGTHYGGTIDDLFFYWYRFHPRFWQRLGLGWNDVERAMARFGVIQQWTREKEEDARRGSGRSDVTVTSVPAPGISARLLPFLLGDLVFLSVLDVGAHMPPRLEVPEIVSMADPELAAVVQPAQAEAREAEEAFRAAQRQVNLLRAQLPLPPAEDLSAALEDQQQALERRDETKAALLEAQRWAGLRDLLGEHQRIVGGLRDLAQHGSSAAALAQGTIPRWWSVLPCVTPAFTVEQRKRGKWGELLKKETLLTAPVLTANHVYPLERRVQELVAQKLDAGQTVMIYFEQNGLRSMAERLAWVLADVHPWMLPNSVEAEDREHAIRAAIRDLGKRVVLVPYRRVMEGLNLQDCIDVVVWYELALNLFHLDQASRRHWRLGRREAAEIIYLAYAGSAAHRKLCKLARESGAAAAFAGEPAKGALVEHVGAHQTMLARLSASLEALSEEDEDEALDGQEELAAAFARRAEDLAATLKRGRQWLGLVDTLPERLVTLHAARVVAAPVIVEAAHAAAPSAAPTPIALPHLAPPTPIKREEVVRGSLWDALEAAEETEPVAEAAPVTVAEEGAEAAASPPVASPPAEVPAPLVQGSITTTRSGLVVTFPANGPHLAVMQQLSRTYGGRFDATSGAWVLPLLGVREAVHVVDAVLEAFPHLSGAEDARLTALETMLSVLSNRYRAVYGREPNEQTMRAQVATCTEALRWLRSLSQRRS